MKWRNKFSGILCCILLITISQSFAQQENVWAFGQNAGLNFNSGTPIAINTSINSNEACASVCNATGQLLFYTNGQRVWDRFNNFMQNGFSICNLNVVSTTQGALIVPMPDSSSKFYIFSLTAIDNGTAFWGRLYYSVVDMNLNNGLGAVVSNRSEILVDSGLQENMTAVAGGSCNIWLLTITQQGILKAFSIDHNGINNIPVESTLIPGSGLLPIPLAGGMTVSPNRTQLAVADVGLTLYDFNATTGMASNPLNLTSPNIWGYYSTCFSPDNLKLYASVGLIIEQFDLSSGVANTITSSKVVIDQNAYGKGTLKLGPDGKIYCATPGPFLGVIQQPNQAGLACNYIGQGIPLSNTSGAYLGLPNVITLTVPTGDTIFSKDNIVVSECFTDTFQLKADSIGKNFVWDNGSNLVNRTINSSGVYWVNYSKYCVMYSDTFVVSFPNASPNVITYPSCEGSKNGMAVAYTPNDGYQYTWRNNASIILSTTDTLKNVAGGQYSLHVMTPSGCEETVDVTILEEEHIASFEVDSIVCQASLLSFNNTSDVHFTQFKWAFGDGDTTALQNPSHSYPFNGNYLVTFIAKGAICTDTLFKRITVDSMLNGRYNHYPDSICVGQSINFISETDSSINLFNWDFGDDMGNIPTVENKVKHAFDKDGIMPVLLETKYRACPSSSFTDTIYVYPLPKIYLGPDTGLCLGGMPILLQNEFQNRAATYKYKWNTNDTTPILKVVNPGTYSLTMSSNPLGCAAKESVIVLKDCYIDIPNAFTPDGDGSNDYFLPRQLLSRNLTVFKMQIINRWGQLIFETNKVNGRGWDGRFNSVLQPQGVYLYFIDLTLENGKMEKYAGNVTLLR